MEIKGAVIAIFDRSVKGEIRVLMQHRRDPYTINGIKVSLLEFQGGGIEPGETALETAYREASEEAFWGVLSAEELMNITNSNCSESYIRIYSQTVVKAVGAGRTDYATIFVAEISSDLAEAVLANQERFKNHPEVSGTVSYGLDELHGIKNRLSPTQRERVVPLLLMTIENLSSK